MIISHKYKFIFIAIPKTGTHAIRFALRKHLAKDDIEQVGLFVKKKAPYKEIASINHGHISANEIKKAVGENIWNSYFKFACVRNPWDRFISYVFFMYRNTDILKKNTLLTLKKIAKDSVHQKRILFAPQYQFITDTSDALMIDYICRQENLQESYDLACKKIGIPTETLNIINKSEHLPYFNYYDDELRNRIADLYQKDISLFHYTFSN